MSVEGMPCALSLRFAGRAMLGKDHMVTLPEG